MVDNLKHNLLSISQLCDKGYCIIFDSSSIKIEDTTSNIVRFMDNQNDNVYTINIEHDHHDENYFAILKNDHWLWHRPLGHTSMNLISRISKNIYVKRLPNMIFEKDKICVACQLGKQVITSFKNKQYFSTTRPLQLLYIDLFGPSRTASLGVEHYAFVMVDNFSRFTWVIF